MQLKTGIREVNERLFEESRRREELRGMGCTLVAAVAEADTLYVANVGDSRLYLISERLPSGRLPGTTPMWRRWLAMGRMDRRECVLQEPQEHHHQGRGDRAGRGGGFL